VILPIDKTYVHRGNSFVVFAASGKLVRPCPPHLEIVQSDTPAFHSTFYGQMGEPNPEPFTITTEGVVIEQAVVGGYVRDLAWVLRET
jgi:hypothetical protein